MSCAAGPDVSENGLVLALDAANKKSYSQNEFQYSTDIFGWSGTSANAATLSRDTISSPVGNTPLKMAVTGNDPHLGTYNSGVWNIAPAVNGQTWVVSVYVKASVATTGQIFIFGANSAGTGFVGGAWLAISAVTVNITTEWTRVSHYITMANANVAFIHTRLDGPDSGGTGQNIWWDGLQVERVPSGTTTPTPFTSSYYGGSVYKDLVGSNNGTLVSYPTYSGSNGGSLVFDHTTLQYLNFSNTSSLQFLNRSPYTLEAWVYPTRNPGASNWTGIFDRESNPGSGRDGYNIYFLGSASTNTTFATERFVAGSAAAPSITLNESVSVNSWSHIVGTYDGTTLSLYRNGSLVGTPATSTGNITNTSKSLTIGVRGGQYFGGRISNSKIYNRALTAQEIQQNFNATRGRFGI
jgi:hypothetical protein